MTVWNGHCQRCGEKSSSYIMSMLNHELICADCKAEERKRPCYAAAEAKDIQEFRDRLAQARKGSE
tara:strand:- start:399 stop:596 length:198 start_codon:yes stop_codon:yes gene_type:complete